jgi:hypothetical protein
MLLMATFKLTAIQVPDIHRLIRLAAPQLLGEHIEQAVAAGLGYASSERLLEASNRTAGVHVTPNRQVFEDHLTAQGYMVESLQLTLLPEAVRLATGTPFTQQVGRGELLTRCSDCGGIFPASSGRDKMCPECMERPGNVKGVENAAYETSVMLQEVFATGASANRNYLRRRPGWADVLDDLDLMRRMRRTRSLRQTMLANPTHKLSEDDLRLLWSIQLDEETAGHILWPSAMAA